MIIFKSMVKYAKAPKKNKEKELSTLSKREWLFYDFIIKLLIRKITNYLNANELYVLILDKPFLA